MKSCCLTRQPLRGTRLLTSAPLSSAVVAAAPLPHIHAERDGFFLKVHPWKVQVILLPGSQPIKQKGNQTNPRKLPKAGFQHHPILLEALVGSAGSLFFEELLVLEPSGPSA